ncbi:hypothetical protein [Pedobacter punctiformis]|uniref:Lipoprotein n=1 Tax=Pedobacter punctiformis TaxID=3004097 RepID=A0ABT4L8H6_9SPHI|nr:hypothetical protein [Pedobacter sp. HCMS5-2]MCZ4244136.1 hypothetical protein [Pedobacter sp. HCMS5-2]
MKNKKNQLIAYFFLTALIVLNSCLYMGYKISFAGYWSDRILFLTWLLATLLLVINFWKKLWTKIYFWLLVAGFVLTVLPMGLPFFAILLSTTGSGRLKHFDLKNNYRLQVVNYGVLGRPRLQLVADGILFDKIKLETSDEIELNDSTWFDIRKAESAKLIKETDTNITVKYFFEKDSVQAVHQLKIE